MKTRAKPLGINLIIDTPDNLDATSVFGAIFQYPGTYGVVRDFTDLIAALHDQNAIGIVCADPLALTLLKEPGSMGADIAVGNTQRFGVPIGYGGPHAAYRRPKMPINAICPAVLWEFPLMRGATKPTGLHFKPANSTSDAKRQRQTSVQRKLFWQ